MNLNPKVPFRSKLYFWFLEQWGLWGEVEGYELQGESVHDLGFMYLDVLGREMWFPHHCGIRMYRVRHLMFNVGNLLQRRGRGSYCRRCGFLVSNVEGLDDGSHC